LTFRETPNAVEVEKHVIGGAMLDPESLSLILEKLNPEDFYLERHRVIFEAMATFSTDAHTFGLVGLFQVLTDSGRLKEAGGNEYLMEISAEVASSAGMDNHIQMLRSASSRRKLIRVLGESLELAYNLTKTTPEVLEQAEAAILSIGETRSNTPQLKPMSAVLRAASRDWHDVAMGKPGGLMSNIGPVDDLLLGFRPGKTYILAARPGLGKSMLALQIAVQCGQPAAHYSLEMLATEQAERMISQECDLNSDSLRSQAVLLAKGKLLAETITKLGHLPIWFCDESPITPAQILSQCRRLKKKHGLGLIVVDYLQLIKGVGKFERRDLEVGSISKFLKSIAMKLEVPVITIASLSRKSEERTDKRPIMSDLRESGDIESDADCVMFLYREADYSNEAKKHFPNVTELIVAKNRGGKKGRSILNFDGAHSKFYGLHQVDTVNYLNLIDPSKKVSNDSQARYSGNPKKVSGQNSDFLAG